MPNYKAAFESASLDLSAIMSLLGFTSYPGVDQVLRAITELILNKAEAQALRDQVKALQSDANSYQSGYDEGRRMGTKHRQSEVEQLTRDLEALRARVVVVPECLTNADSISRMLREIGYDGDVSYHHAREIWNACLDELARLNGKVVSEGLLRRIVAEPAGGAVYDAIAELRALLGEGKEDGDA